MTHSGIQQQVVGLDVSVDEAEGVDGVDGEDSLSDVEPSDVLRQDVLPHQQCHHVACGRAWYQLFKLPPTTEYEPVLKCRYMYMYKSTPDTLYKLTLSKSPPLHYKAWNIRALMSMSPLLST